MLMFSLLQIVYPKHCLVKLVRPPGPLVPINVPKAFCFSRDVFLIRHRISELRAPSADRHETSPRDHYLLGIDNPGPEIWVPLP